MAATTTIASGWTCATCGMSVRYDETHVCGEHPYNVTPKIPSSTFSVTGPNCWQGHAYAVGPTHAICNRCNKVVKLDA